MEQLIIHGGNRLIGKVKIGGAKNSAVALLPAALLAEEESCIISNLPNIEDIDGLKETILELGCNIDEIDNSTIKINTKNLSKYQAINDRVKEMRASYYLIAPLLFKFGQVELGFPGGCSIGARPIDLHLKALNAMGATTEVSHGKIIVSAPNGLKGSNIFFDTVTVGATINTMLFACKAKGTTTITNAAREPHVVDVADFLNKMGAKITGAGTDTITIEGVDKLVGTSHSVIPDQIEAGTYMIAAIATKGDVIISNVIPNQLKFLSSKLLDMGAVIEEGPNYIRVAATERTNGADITTNPYPAFPTDLQQPFATLLAISNGISHITENVWENRFKFLNELQKMGAQFKIEKNMAIIEGVDKLTGADVKATDLRAGAAVVIAGLVAEGKTTVSNVVYIDRGYEYIEEKLTSLGADIKRINVEKKSNYTL